MDRAPEFELSAAGQYALQTKAVVCTECAPGFASTDPTDACEELEIEQPESPGPPSARRVFTPSPPRRGGE